jgi:hypothetical protein
MGRKTTSWKGIASLLVLVLAGLVYLLYGGAIAQAPNPIDTAIADALSPTVVVFAIALVLVFLFAVVLLAVRHGRSVRLSRSGLTIGSPRR